eukprot:6486537-Amphidinium_carterae.1
MKQCGNMHFVITNSVLVNPQLRELLGVGTSGALCFAKVLKELAKGICCGCLSKGILEVPSPKVGPRY